MVQNLINTRANMFNKLKIPALEELKKICQENDDQSRLFLYTLLNGTIQIVTLSPLSVKPKREGDEFSLEVGPIGKVTSGI